MAPIRFVSRISAFLKASRNPWKRVTYRVAQSDMRVMTAMYTLRKGGSYDRFLMMLEALLERKTEVHCLSLTPIRIHHPGFHNHRIHLPFQKVDRFSARGLVILLFPIWAIWIGWRNNIDLIIAFGSLYAFLQGFSKWLLKKRMVTLIRGSLTFASKMKESPPVLLFFNKIVEHMGLLFSDQVITNNTTSQREILRYLGKRKNVDVKVLYNNIPPILTYQPEDIRQTRLKYGFPENAKVLVTAGILNQGKNVEVLINSLPQINIENLYLVIVGDGQTTVDMHYKEFLQGLAKTRRVDKNVIFTGWLDQEELWKVYAISDLFVMPSLSEGMPNAMLEALGSGLPCLGSRVPGIMDILQHEELMFDAMGGNDLVEKLRHYFTDERYANRMIRLNNIRKKDFMFDWKEKLFNMVAKSSLKQGKSNKR